MLSPDLFMAESIARIGASSKARGWAFWAVWALLLRSTGFEAEIAGAGASVPESEGGVEEADEKPGLAALDAGDHDRGQGEAEVDPRYRGHGNPKAEKIAVG